MTYFYYRISDNSYRKEKLVDKVDCLSNFLEVFTNLEGTILADNCDQSTISMIENLISGKDIQLVKSKKGNAGALKKCIDLAIQNLKENDLVYFVEDDYLHHYKANQFLKSWDRSIMQDVSYATFYDHPDKYSCLYGNGETSKVYCDKIHWRETQSTTMTFFTKVKELKLDYSIWLEHTSENHPRDHEIFTKILNENHYRGKLICAIPGLAVHTDLTVSAGLRQVLFEDWALELVEQILFDKLGEIDIDLKRTILNRPKGWSRIQLIRAILSSSCVVNKD